VVWGPFHAQGEYTGGAVDRFAAARVHFDGWYAQAGWFLTGESRNYDLSVAQYKRIKPKRKLGAWEIAARYSRIDLQDADVFGGRESNVTVALNWWVNPVVLFRLNYVRGDLSPNAAVRGGFPETLNALMGRAQVVF
jgi:phosphate-selective porin OprO/OprP